VAGVATVQQDVRAIQCDGGGEVARHHLNKEAEIPLSTLETIEPES
jgi:hypothetical protein